LQAGDEEEAHTKEKNAKEKNVKEKNVKEEKVLLARENSGVELDRTRCAPPLPRNVQKRNKSMYR
jgi:hypothetical protein